MSKDLTGYRKSYEYSALEENHAPDSPFDLFNQWFEEVEKAGGIEETNAMTVATIGKDGFPKSRIVLLKQFDTNGFVFYTNYTSEKGSAIQENPNVCISFFWPNLERQVISKGVAVKLNEKDSTAYFQSRPRGSQLGAWASDQSCVIASRSLLEEKLQQLEKKYDGKTIPKPKFWGGYRVEPNSFEFWQGRPNRLHDRLLYARNSKNNSWNMNRLAP